MILPSQPSKFGARKNKTNFIQVSEALHVLSNEEQ